MKKNTDRKNRDLKPKISLFTFLKPYLSLTIPLFIVSIAANGLGLFIPREVSAVLDYLQKNDLQSVIPQLYKIGILSGIILLVSFLQSIVAAFASEYVARDIRKKLTKKLSSQSYRYIAEKTSSTLLTVFTSDVDAVKGIVSQALVAIFSAVLLLIGSIFALLSINVVLTLITLAVVPFIVLTFALVFGRLKEFFTEGQKNLERINKVINESIVAASLVRVLHSQQQELQKFSKVNDRAKEIGIQIIAGIASLFPVITFFGNIMTLLILWIGGNQVINNTISIGDFNAFFMYAGILFTPIFILSFIGTFISRAMISIERITEVLDAPIIKHDGTYSASLRGDITMKNVSLSYGEKEIIKNISLSIKHGQRIALVGPTAAGKTQLFYLLTGLLLPTSGEILIDSHPVSEYDPKSLFSQIGLVFQDSIVFNTSVRENIQFDSSFSEDNLTKAITTAELDEVISHLPDGLQTTISERGTDLSGGQKQRLMLARALAISPKILLLDDFTARVDRSTESQIFKNLDENYPGITLINITQKIEPVKDYDRIILMIEGEIVAQGTHTELMESSFDYRKIFESQQTINK